GNPEIGKVLGVGHSVHRITPGRRPRRGDEGSRSSAAYKSRVNERRCKVETPSLAGRPEVRAGPVATLLGVAGIIAPVRPVANPLSRGLGARFAAAGFDAGTLREQCGGERRFALVKAVGMKGFLEREELVVEVVAKLVDQRA